MAVYINIVGILLIIGSILLPLILDWYGYLVFIGLFALGSIHLGLGRIIYLLEESKINKGK